MFNVLTSILSVVLLIFVNVNALAQTTQIRVPKPRASFDISHDYHIKLLELALSAASAGNTVTPEIVSTIAMVQGRAEAELVKGNIIDLYWLGAHKERNKALIPINVPTSKGLIGFRKFIIRSDVAKQISSIKTASDLRQLMACQGSHWPDTEIMRNAGFQVTTSPVFNQLFTMLSAGRCDYFPRGYHDAKREVDSLKNTINNIESNDEVLFYYPFAIYFYTSPSKQHLATLIQRGMTEIAKNGQLERLMKTHPLTAHIFPLKKEHARKFIRLSNPFMPDDSEIDNPDYFYQLSDFNLVEID